MALVIGMVPAPSWAEADGLFDSLGGALNSLTTGTDSSESAEPTVNNLNETSASGSSLEGGAVALVEDVQGEAGGLQVMDYVFPDQQIALGQGATLVLSHLDGCLVETIAGGMVTVRPGGSVVSGGQISAERTPDCESAGIVVTADAREAGATVNRVTPFQAGDWREEVTKSDRPTFVWLRGLGKAKVRVVQMDATKPKIIWQRETDASSIVYPQDAPALAPGLPYRVEVIGPDGKPQGVAFMVDPGLDIPSASLASRVVTLVR